MYKSYNKHNLIIISQEKSFGVLVQKYLSLNVEILLMSVLVLTLCVGESTHGPILSREEVAL